MPRDWQHIDTGELVVVFASLVPRLGFSAVRMEGIQPSLTPQGPIPATHHSAAQLPTDVIVPTTCLYNQMTSPHGSTFASALYFMTSQNCVDFGRVAMPSNQLAYCRHTSQAPLSLTSRGPRFLIGSNANRRRPEVNGDVVTAHALRFPWMKATKSHARQWEADWEGEGYDVNR